MADIKALLADPEFKTLSLEGQKKALGRLDPELGGLSDSGFLKFVYQVAPPAGTEKLLGGLSSPLGAPLDPLKPPVLPRSGSPFVQDLNQEPVQHTPSAFRAYPGRAGSQTPFPDPVQDWIGEGMRKMGEGAAQAGSPGQADTTPARQIMGGTSKMFRGGMQAATPFLLPGAAVTAPGALLLGAPTAMALGTGTEAGLNAMGVSPEKSAFGGDVGSVVGGVLGGAMSKPVGSVIDAVRAGWDNPAIRKAAIREIPYVGPKVVRFMEALEPPPPKVYPTPGVTPQGRGIAGFPKPPGAPEPKVYPAPGVTPQGRGIGGFPKPPVEKPFSPGPADKPVFKTTPIEKPFRPPVPAHTQQGWTRAAAEAEPPAPQETSGVPPAVTELLEKLRAQQRPGEPEVLYEPSTGAAPGNAPAQPIRPEDTNPAATYGGKEPLASESAVNWHKLPENQRGRFLNSEFHAAGKDIGGVGAGARGRPSGNAVAKDLFGPDATWMGDPSTAISHARMDAITDFMTNKGRMPTKLDLDSGVFKDPGGGLPKPPK